MSMQVLLGHSVLTARTELAEQVKPRDDFEYAVVNALGEISWDEAVEAINKHRATVSESVTTTEKT